jgi:predicted TIM-barrel fold metal-dependent hydrolase
MMVEIKVVDVWHQPFTPELMKKAYFDDEDNRKIVEWWGLGPRVKGRTPGEFIAEMDRCGVEKVIIPAIKLKSFVRQEMAWDFKAEEVYGIIKDYPTRLYGLYGINPYSKMDGVRELERAVKSYGFIGAHIHTYGYELPINHRRYYPFYAKCVELDVPVMMQVGHSAELMPSEMGRPILLDTIALDFPELRIVGAHTGWPWVEELIAISWKHPNVYIATTAHAPKYWDASLVSFLNTRRGMGKVMYGSDFPVLEWGESIQQIKEKGLRADAFEQLVYQTAKKVFRF